MTNIVIMKFVVFTNLRDDNHMDFTSNLKYKDAK